MEMDPKIMQQFEKLKSDWHELSINPSNEHLEKVKSDLKMFMEEIDSLHM